MGRSSVALAKAADTKTVRCAIYTRKSTEEGLHQEFNSLDAQKENVYFAIGVQGQQPNKGRGKQAGVVALPGLWADIDILGPNHAATNLPPTLEDARNIVGAIPFKYGGSQKAAAHDFLNRFRSP